MKCEVCGTWGRRRHGTCCPEGWLYSEVAPEDEDGTLIEEQALIVPVCGRDCASRFWRKGPGKLHPTFIGAHDVDAEGREVVEPVSDADRIVELESECKSLRERIAHLEE